MNNSVKFISTLAHDLKNTLGNGMMYSELLVSELKELADEHTHLAGEMEGLSMMSENVRLACMKLLNQINSWVLSHHIVSGELEEYTAMVDASVILKKVLKSNKFYFDKKTIKLEQIFPEGDYSVQADKEMLELVLDNMTLQAVAYANDGDKIRVSLEDKNDFIGITVADSYNKPRQELVSRFLGKEKITGNEIPEGGILKPTGFGMIFCGLILNVWGSEPRVEQNDLGGLSFSFKLRRQTS